MTEFWIHLWVVTGRHQRPRKDLWKTVFKKFEVMWSVTDHIISNFLKAVFHKFYLVHSWIHCLICSCRSDFLVDSFKLIRHILNFYFEFEHDFLVGKQQYTTLTCNSWLHHHIDRLHCCWSFNRASN